MASVRAKRSFIKSTDSSSDMNPNSAVVIEDALGQMTEALNRVNDEEPSVTHSENKDCFDETSVHEDSYTPRTQTKWYRIYGPFETEYQILAINFREW